MSSRFPNHNVIREDNEDGTVFLRSGLDLGEVVNDTNVWLSRWAEATPDRVFIAERTGSAWRKITYREMFEATRAVAQGLLDHGLKPGDTLVALSGPSIDHAILMQACQMIGAIIVPLAEQYSLIRAAHDRLQYCAGMVRAVMVYAENTDAYEEALALPVFDNALKITSDHGITSNTSVTDLRNANPGQAIDGAYARINHDTIAKILFTSGSTSHPKGVPNTQRMLCVNQAQYLACLPILGERHHTILDWLPWNHTFAGNSTFNMVLANGMSLHLDDGKPMPGKFDRTLENARQVHITLSFDVPVAHGMKVAAMRDDPELRRAYFGDLDIFFYAGASLPSDIWSEVEKMALAERGDIPLMMSSWGMTETSPATLIMHEKGGRSGNIGLPAPEVVAKLLPKGTNRYELRCRGPNVFTGYYDDSEKTAVAFDDDGFLITGDAVGLVDPDDASRGLFFDGRVSEDFKLATGTWVQASMMRLDLLPRLKGLAQDLVICGEGQSEIGLLLFATPERGKGGTGAVEDPELAEDIQAVLTELATSATGSSNRIGRALVMAEPPNVGDGEVTAKGSLNIRTVLSRRADLLSRLYDDDDAAVIWPL